MQRISVVGASGAGKSTLARSLADRLALHHSVYRQRYTAAMADPAHAHLTFIRVTSRADLRRLPRSH